MAPRTVKLTLHVSCTNGAAYRVALRTTRKAANNAEPYFERFLLQVPRKPQGAGKKILTECFIKNVL